MSLADQLWWPEALCDESMPEGRSSPTDWIIGPAEIPGVYVVAGWPDELDGQGAQQVHIGDIIGFLHRDWCGRVDVTIEKDGSFTAHGVVPEGNCFWELGDVDTQADSMAEFAKFYAENEPPNLLPVTVEVGCCIWSDDIPHRLDLIDGKPVFVRLPDPPTAVQ